MTTAEDRTQMTSDPGQYWESRFKRTAEVAGPAARDSADATWAMLAYLGAIFLGPLIPLAVFLIRRNRSAFMRYHAGQAVNISVTIALYLVCCAILGGMLALDSVTVSLVVALPIVFFLWLMMLKYLIRGVGAANRDEVLEVPGWMCATIVKQTIDLPEAGAGGRS